MENAGDALTRSRRPGFGPAASSAAAPLSRPRAALLELLRGQAEPATLTGLAALSGLHVNTLREHLEALIRNGLVRRRAAQPNGRGRPAWLYLASGGGDSAPSEYAGLAATLAASIHRTSTHPTADATEAGTDWGRRLADGRLGEAQRAKSTGRQSSEDPVAARRQVVDLLDDLGFATQSDADNTVVRLTRCPLLETAQQYPDVVCGVHLGLVRGALTAYGADSEGTELVPFAEPGACLLHLRRP